MPDEEDIVDFSRRSIPSDTYHHNPYAIVFSTDWRTRHGESALLLLNQPIENIQIFKTLWHGCSYRFCADGGANRLYEVFKDDAEAERKTFVSACTYDRDLVAMQLCYCCKTDHSLCLDADFGVRSSSCIARVSIPDPVSQLPNIIHGDLDSLRSSVRNYYSDLGVTVSLDEDQYSTDFGKALKKIQEHFQDYPSSSSDGKTLNVMILGSIGGRVDQGIGLLSEIMREQKASLQSASSAAVPGGRVKTILQMKLYLISPSNLTFLLLPGKNVITFPPGTVQKPSDNPRESSPPSVFTANVGILPLFGPAHITTVGLQYDVADWPTQMGEQVSTSNHIMSDQVHIHTEEYLMFTVEFNLEALGGQ